MNSKTDEILIPVKVKEGMFPSEYSVHLKLANGKHVSFFVDKQLIKKENGSSLLRAILVKEQGGNRYEVLLPEEPFETATRWAEVEL